jgi:hypothetical protein|tara:strand:- start:3359 stop:3592 length:234 start_codon:yes stop_codon:yes gene_type:complete
MTGLCNKRANALKLLEEFKAWHAMPDWSGNIHDQVIIFGLTKDILTGTEAEIDRLIVDLEKQNSKSLMKKLNENMVF